MIRLEKPAANAAEPPVIRAAARGVIKCRDMASQTRSIEDRAQHGRLGELRYEHRADQAPNPHDPVERRAGAREGELALRARSASD